MVSKRLAAAALLSLVLRGGEAWSPLGGGQKPPRQHRPRFGLPLVFHTEQVPSDRASSSEKVNTKLPRTTTKTAAIAKQLAKKKSSSVQTSSSNRQETTLATESRAAASSIATNRAEQLLQEAAASRRRAKELLAEAMEMEADMKEALAAKEKKAKKDSAQLLQKLFDSGRPQTPDAVAVTLQQERVSKEQAKAVVEQLFSELWYIDYKVASKVGKEDSAPLQQRQRQQQKSNINNDGQEMSEAARLVWNRLQCVIEAADMLDRTVSSGGGGVAASPVSSRWSGRVASSLKSHLSELRTMTIAKNDLAEKQAIAEHLARQNLTTTDSHETDDVITSDQEEKQRVKRIPYFEWLQLPKHLRRLWAAQPYVNHTLAAEDVDLIQSKVLNGTSFVWNSTETIASTAAYFRGTVNSEFVESRANSATANLTQVRSSRVNDNVTSQLFQQLNLRMKKEGLDNRVKLFLLNDPKTSILGDLFGGTDESKKGEFSASGHPVIMAVPATVKPVSRPRNMLVNAIRQLLLAWPVLTLFSFSVRSYALNPSFFHAIVQRQESKAVSACAPIFCGIVAIQLVHELAHWWMAKRKGIKISLPFPIPSTELGTFGCITALKSFPANRTDLFDFSMSGPVAAAASSLACMFVGVQRTLHASSQTISTFPTLPVAWFKSSFMSGAILSAMAPKIMTLPLSQPIPIHPLFVIGFSGLLSSALNLLPVTQLDGGRAATAAMGRYGEVASLATFLCVLIAMIAKESTSTLLWSWITFVVLFQRRADIPSRDDYTEINNSRLNFWAMSVAFSVLTLVPFPGYKNTAPTGL
mmetsp:Transcript_6173/g.17362  ORF Transcript_6173/g.17362 Transcript_6173/m.17362 type:complete len:811 (-) Transcript_6173:2297-4729(-)